MTPTSPRRFLGTTAPAQALYTLQFKNGHILRHQDSLTLSQFQSDGRLASIYREEEREKPFPNPLPNRSYVFAS
jgi:hypothetical protein